MHQDANEVAVMPPPRNPFLLARIDKGIRCLASAAGYDIDSAAGYRRYLRQQCSVLSASEHYDNSSGIGASGQPEIFLLGDSHAGHLRDGLGTFLREKGLAGYAVSCPGTDMFDATCPESQSALRKLSDLPRVKHVVLSESWDRGPQRDDNLRRLDARYAQLEAFAATVKSMGKTLFILTDVPHYPFSENEIRARARIVAPRSLEVVLNSRQQPAVEYDRVQGPINAKLAEICRKTGAVLIPLHLAFKQDDRYVCVEDKGGEIISLYRDTDHLSPAGSLRAAGFLMSYLCLRTDEREQLPGRTGGLAERVLEKTIAPAAVLGSRLAERGLDARISPTL